MLGEKKLGLNKTDRLMRKMIPRPEIKTPIASDMFLPNHSGKHENLKARTLTVFGESIFQDSVTIQAGVPTLTFDDTHQGHDKYRIRIEDDVLCIGAGSPNVDILCLDSDEMSVFTAKSKLTVEGGIAIKLKNNTGSASVKGQLVEPDPGEDNAVVTVAISSDECIGIVYDAGVADGSDMWVVVSGIADVLIDAGGCASSDRLISSATAGSADVWNVGGAVATHFQEIGHSIGTVVGAGLAKVVLHFN